MPNVTMDDVTASTTSLAASLLAEQPHLVDARLGARHGPGRHRDGAAAGGRLAIAPLAGCCGCRWRQPSGPRWPAWAHWYITADGLADDPAPRLLWWWIALERSRRGDRGPGLAQRTLVAARRIAAGRAAVSAQHRTGAQPMGRLLPHRADRVEPAHRRSAARPDRQATVTAMAVQAHPASPRQPWCR